MSTEAPEHAARKRFLEQLLATLDERWSADYEVVSRFAALAMNLRCEGVDGYVQVIPSSVLGGLAVS